MVDGEQDLHETTKTELIALAGPETEGEDPDDRLVNIDSWMVRGREGGREGREDLHVYESFPAYVRECV
jgi:hypothetical protein